MVRLVDATVPRTDDPQLNGRGFGRRWQTDGLPRLLQTGRRRLAAIRRSVHRRRTPSRRRILDQLVVAQRERSYIARRHAQIDHIPALFLWAVCRRRSRTGSRRLVGGVGDLRECVVVVVELELAASHSSGTAAARSRSLVVATRCRHGDVERTNRYLIVVPVPVVLERVEDIETVGVDEIRPRLPKRMDDVVDEADLQSKQSMRWRRTSWHIYEPVHA